MPIRGRTAALAAIVLMVVAGTVGVAAGGPLRADLGGRPIALDDVARYHCHDADYPLIHCFLSQQDLLDSVARYTADAEAEVGATGTAYVRAYADASFGGSSFTFTADYSNLGTIGWNDRISSFLSLNCGAGEFREHAGYAGFRYPFWCGDRVAYVGDAYNDRFSAVRRQP